MNSRFVDVKERRLKTIYDALDAANNKKAIQEAEKVLRKDPQCQTAKALKGLALFRSNRASEASGLLSELAHEEPCDEACLQAMTYYYREAGCHENICEIYETANKKKPNNEDIMTTLFMSHVRLMNYQRQQQVARDLHKIMPAKMPYFFWSVMSLFMQAKSAKSNLGAKMFLPLAEKMVKKVMNEGRLKAEAEYELYLMILEEQEKFDEALEFLNSSPFSDSVLKDRCGVVRYEMNYRRQLTQDYQLHMKCKELVKEDPDDWAMYKEFLERGMKVIKNNELKADVQSEESHSEQAVSMKGMISFLEAMRVENPSLRGPQLGYLILLQLTRAEGTPDGLGSPQDMLRQFFRSFGGKPACPLDLQPFIEDLVEPEARQELLDNFEAIYTEVNKAEEATSELPATLTTMYMRLAIESLRRRFGFWLKLSNDERQLTRLRLMKIYEHSLAFGDELEKTEIQPADGFVQLAALLHVDDWLCDARAKPEEGTAASVHLWRAVVMLEKALHNSRSNHHLKICLLKIYCFLGAFQPALSSFQNLDIKHVQYDSLGYLICQPGLHLACFSSGLNVWNNIVKFFSLNRKDMMEYVVSAFRSGSFRKVPEFIDFHQRLTDSFQFNWCKVELRLQTILSNSAKFEELLQTFSDMAFDVDNDEMDFDALVDGRDFNLTLTFEPKESDFSPADQEASFVEEKRWIRLRNLTSQSFALACKFVMDASKHVMAAAEGHNGEPVKNGDISDSSSKLSELASSLQTQLDALKTATKETDFRIHNGSLKGAYPSVNSMYVHGCYVETLKRGLTFMSYINKLSQNPSVHDPEFEAALSDFFLKDLQATSEQLKESFSRLPMADFLTRLVCLAESVSLGTIFLMSAHSLFRPFRKTRSKRRKKGGPVPVDCTFARALGPVDAALQAVCGLAESLGEYLSGLQEAAAPPKELDTSLAELEPPLKEDLAQTIRENVAQSFCASLHELRRMMEYVSGRAANANA